MTKCHFHFYLGFLSHFCRIHPAHEVKQPNLTTDYIMHWLKWTLTFKLEFCTLWLIDWLLASVGLIKASKTQYGNSTHLSLRVNKNTRFLDLGLHSTHLSTSCWAVDRLWFIDSYPAGWNAWTLTSVGCSYPWCPAVQSIGLQTHDIWCFYSVCVPIQSAPLYYSFKWVASCLDIHRPPSGSAVYANVL